MRFRATDPRRAPRAPRDRRARAAAATAPLLALAALLAALPVHGCGPASDARSGSSAAGAESLGAALRGALDDRLRPPVTLAYGRFADPRTGDSLSGYVLHVSAPFEMVAEDSMPHEWLRERLRAGGWTLDDEADGPDGSSYRARRESQEILLQATWEDLQPPLETPEWYALTVGIPSPAPAPPAGGSR